MPFFLLLFVVIFVSCSKDKNPFFTEWDTKFQVPPFEKIKTENYMPAFERGIAEEKSEVQTIVNNPEAPTFQNTIVEMEKGGKLLSKVSTVFYALKGADTNDELNKIAEKLAPLLSQHYDEIALNEQLFQRIKTVYDNQDKENLTTEELTVLTKYYKDFVRSGALLSESQKEEIKIINTELSSLTLKFADNVLGENNKFELVITDEKDLAGLPESSIIAGKEAADEKGYENSWVFTIHKPSMIPFLTYAENRDLRERIFKGYINKGDNNDELDNKEIIKKIVNLRIKKANMLGYKTHSHYVLERTMAKTPENVYNMLMQIWKPALDKAKVEAYDLQQLINREGHNFTLEAWDWWFYAEKLKKEKYGIDESMLRPYFQMENVRKGAFDLATKLWGITFKKIDNIPVYHPEVEAFEVIGHDNSHIGVLYTDYYPRGSKQNGAWMDAFRRQSNINGDAISPIIYNVGNFSKPVGDKPALLSFDEVNTLFHEFGHALHGLLSKCNYPRVSGTNVSRDFVEFPSQIMENWAGDSEFMKEYAIHYETGETIPDGLINKIKNAGTFNKGFVTLEYMAASLLDLDWHTQTDYSNLDVNEFENQSMEKIGLIDEIVVRYRSTYFKHIFAGGYASGYYSYIWSEVLDSDAFQAFKETSLYDNKTAALLREHVLSKGGSEDEMGLYVKFRGREPKIDALLEKRGLK